MTKIISINDIPNFLKNSELYDSLLSLNNESLFNIEDQYLKKFVIITCFEDLISYIKIFDYWMVNYIPDEFYYWVYENKNKINMEILNEQFPINDLTRQIKDIIKVKYLYECEYFSSIGDLRLLRHAHENGFMWNSETCRSAAYNGHLDCLIYAHKNGCPWDEWTCSFASEKGHLDCLKYAHENGCPWDESTCSHASYYGYLDCLKYAHENGCKLTEYSCDCSSYNDHLDCLKYARENLY